MQRLAWFSPMPPVRSGIAACSDELVSALRNEYAIDVYVDEPVARRRPAARSAHEFVWRHRQTPYDLTIYQLGNSSHHDYLWPYLFRYPGLTVLHDVHLHHARAAALLRAGRVEHYREEFRAAHPDVSGDAAELAVAGYDSHLYYLWPMTRLVAQVARTIVVHTPRLAAQLREAVPGAAIETIHLGHGGQVTRPAEHDARLRVRTRFGIAEDAVLFGCFGGLSPDKRVPQVLEAFSAVLEYYPNARLLLAGAPAAHYDVAADIASRSLQPSVVLAGYLESEDELTDCIAACDVTLNLRWPSAREVSGPWLRCLAAGRPTIVIDLAHIDVPSLDPRTWTVNVSARPAREAANRGSRAAGIESGVSPPVCVAIDIVDEDHSLRLAMRRLAGDPELRASLGRAAAAWWQQEHAPETMIDDYRRVIPLTIARPAPLPEVPPHLIDDGSRLLRSLLQPFGIANPIAAPE